MTAKETTKNEKYERKKRTIRIELNLDFTFILPAVLPVSENKLSYYSAKQKQNQKTKNKIKNENKKQKQKTTGR